MKNMLVSAAIALVAPVVLADQPAAPAPPLISTTGTAEIRVVPDLADLCFEVEVRNADLTVARKQQADRAGKLLAALRAAGISENELQSSQVQIIPEYSDRRQETEKLRFYTVSQSICCTIHDVKKVPDLTSEAVVGGATAVRTATLRTSQLRKYRDEARAKAIQAAKEKAIALATELGAKVGKPYTITEDSAQNWRVTSSNYAAQVQNVAAAEPAGDGTMPTFAPGTISVTASVSVSFLLE